MPDQNAVNPTNEVQAALPAPEPVGQFTPFERLKREHATCQAALKNLQAGKAVAEQSLLEKAKKLEEQANNCRAEAAQSGKVFEMLIQAETAKIQYLESAGSQLQQPAA